VQFESNLLQGLERTLDIIVRRGALGASPALYLASIRAALASEAPLADVLPMRHSEAEIRQFLAAVESRLEAEAGVA